MRFPIIVTPVPVAAEPVDASLLYDATQDSKFYSHVVPRGNNFAAVRVVLARPRGDTTP
jgi:hypothetical protein